jgi:hypothetical protein
MGTHWEFERNMLGTKEMENILPHPPKNLKKKIKALSVHAELVYEKDRARGPSLF